MQVQHRAGLTNLLGLTGPDRVISMGSSLLELHSIIDDTHLLYVVEGNLGSN